MFRFFSFHYLLLRCLVFTCFCVCSCVLCLLCYLVIINLHHLLISKNSLKITFSWLVIISLLSYMFFFSFNFLYCFLYTSLYFFFNLQPNIAISNIYFARTWKSFFLLFIQLFQFIFSPIIFFFLFYIWIMNIFAYFKCCIHIYDCGVGESGINLMKCSWWRVQRAAARRNTAPPPHTHKSMHEHSFFWLMIQNIFVICIICK